MAIYTVNNTFDSPMNVKTDDGSLRGEIMASNANSQGLPNRIVFALPAGVQTINLQGPLPAVTQQVNIDGTTANGFDPVNPRPLIEINGNSTNFNTGTAFTVTSTNVTLRDLIIDNFQNGGGITLNGSNDAVIGCWIGIDPTGEAANPNQGVGITISSSNNVIGNPSTNPNVISGNSMGIQITGNQATGNLVTHTYVGTDALGTKKLGNTFAGIEIDSAKNTIGGISATGPRGGGAGDLISGNGQAGLTINNQGAINNLIEGNYIGTDVTGMRSVANGTDGIDVSNARSNTIGGALSPGNAGPGNVISSNGGIGVNVAGAVSTNVRIQGNLIGVTANGTSPLGNVGTGILVNGASNTLIGGTLTLNDTEFSNVIANNGSAQNLPQPGIEVLGASSVGILSNSIYNNGGLGIVLNRSNAGVNPPTLFTAQTSGPETQIVGRYDGNPKTAYRLQFFANQIPNASGAGDGQIFLGDLDVVTNSTGTALFNTVLSGGGDAVGDFVSATATQQVNQVNNTSQFGVNVQATQASVTDLSVTTQVPTNGPLLNQNYTYTITVTNGGPNAATGVVLTDTIPTNSTFVSSTGGVNNAGVVTDNIGNLAVGATAIIKITVKPTSTSGSFVNTAVVSGNQLDMNVTNNTSTTTQTTSTNADLLVTLSPASKMAPVGSPLVFSLVAGNNGPSTANNTVVTVNLPANFTNIIVNADQGTYSVGANNTITINTGILPASTSSSIIITATPTATGNATVSASVTSSLPDATPGNNTTSTTVTIANGADLGITVNSAPNPVLIGQELLYTLLVTNIGPSTATQPAIYDPIPAGLSFDPAHSNAGGNGTLTYTGGAVKVQLNPMAANSTDTITIAVIPTVSGQVTNTAIVGDPNLTTPAEIDPDLTNNTASTTTQISPADLGVTILNPADPLLTGTPAVFQVQVINNGPATATNVKLNDLFGGNVKITGVSTGSISGNAINANLGSLASGATATLTIAVTPTASGTLNDTATVTSDELDPNSNNNTASSTNLVSPVDLSAAVTAYPNPILVGNPFSYIVTVTNHGLTTASNVLFFDNLPSGGVFGGVQTSQGVAAASSASFVSGNLGSLAPGASATVVINVTSNTVGTDTNLVTVTSDQVDTNPANNVATGSVNVINLPGTIEFGSGLTFVPENAGSVTLTLNRIGGTQGTVAVEFTTSDYTALAGTNYVAAAGPVTFAPGQTTATITIPVLDDLTVNGNNGFFVTLSGPIGGASLGPVSVAAVVVTNTDRDTTPPAVSTVSAIPNGSAINGFVISFDKAMDPTRASLVSNYHVYLSNSDAGGVGQTAIPLAAANYNPTNHTVTLVPTAPLPGNQFYHLIVNGSYGMALTDLSGNILYGSTGLGTNFDIYYGQGTSLRYDDSQGNLVTINLSGGGTMSIFRASNGDAAAVNLNGIVPHVSRLTGGVQKLSKNASGVTHIGIITGFGKFGDVYSTLTTPQFYVGSAPVSASSLGRTVSAASVSTKTPKGPKITR